MRISLLLAALAASAEASLAPISRNVVRSDEESRQLLVERQPPAVSSSSSSVAAQRFGILVSVAARSPSPSAVAQSSPVQRFGILVSVAAPSPSPSAVAKSSSANGFGILLSSAAVVGSPLVQASSVAQSSSIAASPSPSLIPSPLASPSPSSLPSGLPDQAYINLVLYHHNVHRANNTAPAIAWSQSLADTAQLISNSCVFAHNTTANGGGYGQNLAAGYGTIAQAISDGWYNSEVNSYTYYGGEPNLSLFGDYGHFTQVVWVSSTTVGCAQTDCSSKGLGTYYVCNYQPPGNYVGAFSTNVLRPIGEPTVTGG